jgi:hypothetical protein
VTSDVNLTALYNKVMRGVVINTSPIALQVTVGGVPVQSGQPFQIDDGATITISVPQEAIFIT